MGTTQSCTHHVLSTSFLSKENLVKRSLWSLKDRENDRVRRLRGNTIVLVPMDQELYPDRDLIGCDWSVTQYYYELSDVALDHTHVMVLH